MKEQNSEIREIISPTESARYSVSYLLSFLLLIVPNFLAISEKNSLIIFISLLSFLISSLALLYFFE
jgi:hypothetical protein